MSAPAYVVPGRRASRPPLTARQKHAVALGGIVGFLLVNLGWAPFAIVIVLFAATILVYFFSAFAGGTDHLPTTAGGVSDAFASTFGLQAAALDAILIGACIVGLALMVLGIIASTVILRRARVNHPVGVTWAALAIAIVANWVLGGFLSFVGSAIANAVNPNSGTGANGVVIVVGLVVAVVFEAVVGWLAWWWMAHVMRHRIPPAP